MKHLLTLAALCLVMASCSKDEIETTKYAPVVARYSCTNVASLPPLFAACNNPGIWCTVRLANGGRRYQIDAPGMETAYWNITASLNDQAHAWMAGLIIGTPSYPEPGATQSIVTSYDLACPVCYAGYITHALAITTTGKADCDRCGSSFDLNNQGIIVSGNGAVASTLFRYRTTYLAGSNTVLVSN